MKYCRFILDNHTQYGAVAQRDGELWIDSLIPAPEEDLAFRVEHGGAVSSTKGFTPMPLKAADLLPPVTPSKIICVGRNYSEHAKELGNEVPSEPLLFFKPPSSLLAPGGVVKLPGWAGRIDYEGELVLVIDRRVRHFNPEDNWHDVVRGFTLANDVSARALQKKDVQNTRGKGFDSFCPIGPLVSDEIDLDTGVTVETRLNGELRQHGSTRDFIFPIPEVLRYITAFMTLEPGDIVLTGTPSGVGPLTPGDRIEVTITGLGILAHSVQADSD
jgi:2-keto-4-pentenoate hydratase/2-oxohepta-3-ene-1,7-dioic acid hydratase in catechol pathway